MQALTSTDAFQAQAFPTLDISGAAQGDAGQPPGDPTFSTLEPVTTLDPNLPTLDPLPPTLDPNLPTLDLTPTAAP